MPPADDDGDSTRSPIPRRVVDRSARIAVVVLLVSAFPIIMLFFGNERWFVADEWILLTTRSLSLHDLAQPYNGHCIAIPIAMWRLIFHVTGLRSYAYYQWLVVGAHLTVCAALWLIVRRTGVRPWIALCGVAMLVYFGSGADDIVYAFQITITGALALGLTALIITDIERRSLGIHDAIGLVLDAAALLFSGLGVVAVFMVATSTLLKRGWKVAAFHSIPLGLLYAGWYLTVKPPRSPAVPKGNVLDILRRITDWTYHGYVDDFRALGRTSFGVTGVVAVCLAALVIVGMTCIARQTHHRGLLRQHSLAVACAGGSLIFLVLNGYERAGRFISDVGQTKYIYVGCVLLVPLIALAAEAIVSRTRMAAPAALCVLLIGIPANLTALHAKASREGFAYVRDWAASIGATTAAGDSSPNTELSLPYVFNVPVLWLAHLHRDGKLPPAPQGNAALDNLVRVSVGLEQLPGRGPRHTCQVGRRYSGISVKPPLGSFLDLSVVRGTQMPTTVRTDASISITLIDQRGRPLVGGRRTVSLADGHRFKILDPGIDVQLSSPSGPVQVCR